MSHTTILVATDGASRIITFNRPGQRNAVSHLMMREVTDALIEAQADADIRCVILTGGPEFFSAGRDLKEAARSSGEEREQAKAALRRMTDTMETLKLPVVAAIEGHCLTGGLELALCCDLRVAGSGATFGITSARLGTIPGFGGTQRLPRVVGMARALEILFSAEPIDVEEAWRIGLINRKAAKGQALAEALRMVSAYADRAPLSLATLKQAVRMGTGLPLADALDLEQKLGATLINTADRAEGLAAFMEKRKPRFQGR
ncbi:enoyl-CoA hydratase-related protein [Pigmentiphaga soli]|uniref:Enoyl-CoA hydratase-related protein n=1 Tax=Pigmentiphaga soli TaxID=1007095 RepID=A0ABP8HGK1_9BURK